MGTVWPIRYTSLRHLVRLLPSFTMLRLRSRSSLW